MDEVIPLGSHRYLIQKTSALPAAGPTEIVVKATAALIEWTGGDVEMNKLVEEAGRTRRMKDRGDGRQL